MRNVVFAAVAGAVLATLSSAAIAQSVEVYVGPPDYGPTYYSAPPAVYAPPPVVYAPPAVVYERPTVVYRPRVYGYVHDYRGYGPVYRGRVVREANCSNTYRRLATCVIQQSRSGL